jgi:hypothetical protein
MPPPRPSCSPASWDPQRQAAASAAARQALTVSSPWPPQHQHARPVRGTHSPAGSKISCDRYSSRSLSSQVTEICASAAILHRGCDNHTGCPGGSSKEPTWTRTTTAGSPAGRLDDEPPGQVRRYGAVRARRPGGSRTTANGRRRPPPAGPAPAAQGGSGQARERSAGQHSAGVPAPVAPGSPAAHRKRIPHQASSAWSSAVLPVLGGKRLRSLIAADRAAPPRVPAIRWGQRHHEDAATDLGAHEPVRGRLGRVEQRAAGPHVVDIVIPRYGCLNRCAT